MVKKKQKPDKPAVNETPPSEAEQPVTATQVNATLTQFAEGITAQVSKLLKDQQEQFAKEINRLDNKSNTVARQVDKTRDAPAESPKFNPMEIMGTIERILTSPIADKIASAIMPKEQPITNVAADPEYIAYIKARAKSFDDLLQAQLSENLESLKLKNLTARKELESDF